MSSSAKRICLEPSDTQGITIEKLCDDVLVEIFSCLSAEELKSASFVSKQWNEVIGSSAVTMKKFKLKLKESELIGRQVRSSRNYQNIELEMMATKDEPPSNQKSFENLGRFFELSQMKYFKIVACNQAADPENAFMACFDIPSRTFSIDAMKLTAALKQMKQLQELFIESPAGFRGSFTSAMDLPKLTKLAVNSPDVSIFQWISASNVTEIDLSHQSFGDVSVQILASFLKLCKRITTLKLDSSLLRDLFGNDKWKDFNLKLSGLDIEGNATLDATSLSEFLISQAPNLTSLGMNLPTYLSGLMIDPVTEALGRLKNLKILSIDHYFRHDGTFLKQLTELEQLTLRAVTDINNIARFNRKLTYLKIESVGNSLDAGMEFSELKHLCIGLDRLSEYLKVIKSSPRVETIELKPSPRYRVDAHEYAQRCDEIIKAGMQHPTLRHLKLEYLDYNFGHLKKAFDMITSDYRNLKSLSLSKKVGSKLRSVEFLLPENRSDWNDDEQRRRLVETFGDK